MKLRNAHTASKLFRGLAAPFTAAAPIAPECCGTDNNFEPDLGMMGTLVV